MFHSIPPGNYGWGCACMTVEDDAQTKRIVRIVSSKTLPLARCRADEAIADFEKTEL
jgi:hypothetical protein